MSIQYTYINATDHTIKFIYRPSITMSYFLQRYSGCEFASEGTRSYSFLAWYWVNQAILSKSDSKVFAGGEIRKCKAQAWQRPL